MPDPQRGIKSFAIEVLRDPTYLAALEARLLRGDCPDVDAYRHAIFHGPLSKEALQGIRWHPGLRRWVGQVYVDDELVWRGQYRMLGDAVEALEAAIQQYGRGRGRTA